NVSRTNDYNALALPSRVLFFQRSCDHRDLHSFPTRLSSDLTADRLGDQLLRAVRRDLHHPAARVSSPQRTVALGQNAFRPLQVRDRKSTRLNSSHVKISYAVFCLKKKKKKTRVTND